MDILDAKARLTIPDLWQQLDLPGQPKTSCKSPFREEKHASFSVSTDGQLWNDFGTNEGGDAIDFLRLATGLSPEAAFKKFIELAGGGTHEARPLPKRPAPERKPESKPKPTFPDFLPGTDAELHELAALRNLSFHALNLARHEGLLRFVERKGRRAWIVTDSERVNAQARRMDGEPWAEIEAKAWTLAGSWGGWPLGVRNWPRAEAFLIAEGGPDFLAAMHFIFERGAEARCYPLAMLGAKMSIHADALPIFTGKRVRLFPHEDTAGQAAAERWTRQLEAVGAEVDAFSFSGLRKADGTPVEDLNDCTQIHPDDAHELEALLP